MAENYLTSIIDNHSELIKLDETNEEMTIEGSEGYTLSFKDNKSSLPMCNELFIDLSKKFPKSNYEGYAKLENSFSSIMDEYFIYYEDGKLRIISPEPCEVIPFDWNDYKDFLKDFCYKNNLTKEKFNEYKKQNEDVLYRSESGNIYSKKEYYDTKKEIYSFDLNVVNDETFINSINSDNVGEIFLMLTDEQKKR